MSFAEQVAESEFERAEREFVELGAEHGLRVAPIAEIEAAREGKRAHGYQAGPVQVGPRTAADFRRPTAITPVALAPEQPKKKTRREIHFDDSLVELVYMNDRTGEAETLYARRIPSTEIPYMHRLESRLEDVQLLMRRLDVTDDKSRRQLEKYAGQYNAIMEEMIGFQIELRPGQYATFDAAVINQLQRQLREIQSGADLGGDDRGNS